MPQKPRKPSAKKIGETMRGALKSFGKAASSKTGILDVAKVKRAAPKSIKAKLPRPVITAGLKAHRRSIASRAASPRKLSGRGLGSRR